ncbi:MAG: hypothetical protein Q7V58_07260 [Actinomycetota bacterium]|nr:hypothetical protein [Actinomycetota bacterium]
MDVQHRASARRIGQFPGGRFTGFLYVASCSVCPWTSTDAVTLSYAKTAAARHEREQRPGYQPPVERPQRAHGIIRARRLGFSDEITMDCRCGQQWTGRDDLVWETAAKHLSLTPARVAWLLAHPEELG